MSGSVRVRLPLRRTLFGWISLAVAVVGSVLAVVQYFTLRWTLSQADDVVVQVQQWNVAQEYANAIERRARSPLAMSEVQLAMHQLSRLNPQADAYLVDRSGEIRYSFAPAEYSPKVSRISTEPIDRFLSEGASQRAPIYGDDPESPGGRAVFSAAPVTIEGGVHYLYVVVGGARRARLYQLFSENLLARYFSVNVITGLLVILISATLLFYGLSRRVDRTIRTMRAFKDGDFSSRIGSTAKDELGELATTFDEMADKIVNSVRELEQRDALRRELIAAVSHDLRGPLANIKAHLERLRQRSTDDSAARTETLETVSRNADQLGELLSQLFELAKLEAREVAPQLEEHLIEPLFEDLLISYRPKALELGITLEYALRDPALMVWADLTMLGRILSNLIENALRFTQPGGRITIEAVVYDGAVRIAVRDTGSGISESDLAKIFERFYQGEGASIRNLSSCGLGLAIVRRLVELQGAEIRVQSKVDVGTEFYFSLRCV